MKADGLSLDDKRQEIADNDIPDIIERFNHLDAETDRKERIRASLFLLMRLCQMTMTFQSTSTRK